MSAFVGTCEVTSSDELKKLLEKLVGESNYYFLRSPHETTGFVSKLAESFASAIEGQMFNSDLELRWKRRGGKFSVLQLSRNQLNIDGFEPVGDKWEIRERSAVLYGSEETRFPRRFSYGENKPNIRQRYFLDAKTSTVHFVALTVL